ncbi:MAG TPA: permease [Sumerlaeia bacterium]|nr:permease [Sumerlaeia bacterium]
MDLRKEWKPVVWTLGAFACCFFLPVGTPRFDGAVGEALHLVKEYAREHVILCLAPAFLIAGAIGVFISHASVMKYLGARANRALAYGVASVSGAILAVCSCTVLPLFAGIYRMGAGLGPATAFLYAGPAINVLAIVLTARVLGLEMGVARAVGAVGFSVVIGLLMHWVFRKEEREKSDAQMAIPEPAAPRPLWQNMVYFGAMIAVLVFANWAAPTGEGGFAHAVYAVKWPLTVAGSVLLGVALATWFGMTWRRVLLAAVPPVVVALFARLLPADSTRVWSLWVASHAPMLTFAAGVAGLSVAAATSKGEPNQWMETSWGFAKQILPLLLIGVLIAGASLGRPGHEGLIPSEWISRAVGGNSPRANLFASAVGALMYFATLTEVPIVEGLIANGMGKGPALALLLAGPALSLPNMLVIRSVMGTKKTTVFVSLVVVMATITGMVYGALAS